MTEIVLIVVALALVAACGMFVAAEFAFITVDRASAERAAEAGDKKAAGVVKALRSLSTQLSATQLGITVTSLVIGYLAEPAIADLLDGPLESIGITGGAATAIALAIAIILATGVTMVFGELVPKNLAIAAPLATAKAVQGFQRRFTDLVALPIRVLNTTANAILRRIGIEPQEELASARSGEELRALARRSAEQGTLPSTTATLLERSVAFGERRASDVMTPRTRVHVLDADAPALAVLEKARATGRSRFPVLADDGGDVLGVVHVKHAMGVPFERRAHVPVRDVMAPPVLVPSSVELDPLLATLKEGGLQMAVVVDEWGNVDGIVTLEDLIEELVGEVRDEHDARDDRLRAEGPGRWNISGLLRPDEVALATGIFLPQEEDYETVAGLVGDRLERHPQEGDRVEIEALDSERVPLTVALTVVAMDGLRVDRIRLERA